MDLPDPYAVILAGGSGTRFWPASRAARPKQFLPIAGGRPMIAETLFRLEGLVPPERALVVTSAAQVGLVREALPELPPENVLAEPEGRNTAAAVALAAFHLRGTAGNPVQLVLPADHVVDPSAELCRALRAAAEEAASGQALLTFGIRPRHPATGYGYIEVGERLDDRDGIRVYRVARFVEKPDAARAREFVASGAMLWNSGMFVWRTEAILAALAAHAPAISDAFRSWSAGEDLSGVYAGIPRLPVDVAVLEKADNVRVVAVEFSWNDVGSWEALADVHPADAEGNHLALSGGSRLLADEARDCIVFAEGGDVVALIGVRDLVVVRSGGAMLVCHRDRAQEVRAVAERLRDEGSELA